MVVALWSADLADLDDATLEAAGRAYRRSTAEADRWFPTPGRLLAFTPERRVERIDDADEAWGKVIGIAQSKGRAAGLAENRHRWDSAGEDYGAALWAGIEACGGWIAICDSTQAEHGTMRAAFRGAYRSHRERQIAETETRKVIGMAEGARRLADGAPRALPEKRGGGFKPALGGG